VSNDLRVGGRRRELKSDVKLACAAPLQLLSALLSRHTKTIKVTEMVTLIY
jgi:hypothetical protein